MISSMFHRRRAGAPWVDKLLTLPSFLQAEVPAAMPEIEEIEAGFRLSGFFLERHLFDPRGIPVNTSRVQLINGVLARLGKS